MSDNTGGNYARTSHHDYRRKAAYLCARVILEWHMEMGITLAPSRIRDEAQASYAEAVRRYATMDLHEAETQRQLAREQVAGVFEWMYSEPCPQELWYRTAAELQVDLDCRESLGAAGQLLRELVEHIGEGPEPQLRRTVRVRDREQLLKHAEEFYSDLTTDEALEIGGKNLLLSCSLERTPFLDSEQLEVQEVTLLRPEILGMTPASQPDGLIDVVRSGRLTIVEAVGGPSQPEMGSIGEEE